MLGETEAPPGEQGDQTGDEALRGARWPTVGGGLSSFQNAINLARRWGTFTGEERVREQDKVISVCSFLCLVLPNLEYEGAHHVQR